MARKRSFGQIARLPSKRYRARYPGPHQGLHNAPLTFQTREDAEACAPPDQGEGEGDATCWCDPECDDFGDCCYDC